MIPIGSSAPKDGHYVLVVALIVACLMVFFWQQSLSPRDAHIFIVSHALIPLRYREPQVALMLGLDPNDFAPFFTMAFLHGGWVHLIGNMWMLWLFGRAVEARLGIFRFALLYLSCALLASGSHFFANIDSSTPTLGASGAVAGVIGAYAMLFPRSRIIFMLPIWFVPPTFRIPALIIIGLWFGLQVFYGAGSLQDPAAAAGVAWWAHIGGFIAGLLFAHILTPPGGPAPEPAVRIPRPGSVPSGGQRPGAKRSDPGL